MAIIGVVTADTPVSTHPRNVAGLKFSSPETPWPVSQGIAGPGRPGGGPVPLRLGGPGLAPQVPGIDVIIGGHSHTKLQAPEVVNRTIIGQAWEHAKALGVLDLTSKTVKSSSTKGTGGD